MRATLYILCRSNHTELHKHTITYTIKRNKYNKIGERVRGREADGVKTERTNNCTHCSVVVFCYITHIYNLLHTYTVCERIDMLYEWICKCRRIYVKFCECVCVCTKM